MMIRLGTKVGRSIVYYYVEMQLQGFTCNGEGGGIVRVAEWCLYVDVYGKRTFHYCIRN
jgi:hypothetical protein